jgi:tetratricopeptide (TPR) repeat protein
MRSEGVVNAHLGALALAQHDMPTAARRYREAIALFRQLGEPAPEAIYRHQLGIVLQEAGEHGEAEKEYRESARIAEARGDAIGAAHTWLQLGLLSESAGKHQAAEAWYHKALQGYRSGGDTAGLSRTSGNLAALLYEQPGRLAEARKLAEEALALKLTLGPGARQIWTTYNLLAEIADKENEPTRAQEYRRRGRTAYRNYPGSREDVSRYARLVAAVVASARGDRAAQQAVRREQRTMRQSGGEWTRFALFIDQVLAGERDMEALTANLNALTSLIAEAILEAIKQA